MSFREKLNSKITSVKLTAQNIMSRFSSNEGQDLNHNAAVTSLPEKDNNGELSLATKGLIVASAALTATVIASASILGLAASRDYFDDSISKEQIKAELRADIQNINNYVSSVFNRVDQSKETQYATTGIVSPDTGTPPPPPTQSISVESKNAQMVSDIQSTEHVEKGLGHLSEMAKQVDYPSYVETYHSVYNAIGGYNINHMEVSPDYLQKMKIEEGERRNRAGLHYAYNDGAGVLTIGYGHTGYVNGVAIHEGMQINDATADRLFAQDVKDSADWVKQMVSNEVVLTQGQFEALVDFTFNKGKGALEKSTLLEKVNENDVVGAAYQFGRWIYANVSDGNGGTVKDVNGNDYKQVMGGLKNRADRNQATYVSDIPQAFLAINSNITALSQGLRSGIASIDPALRGVTITGDIDSPEFSDSVEKTKRFAQFASGHIQDFSNGIDKHIVYLESVKENQALKLSQVEQHMNPNYTSEIMGFIAVADMAEAHLETARKHAAPFASSEQSRLEQVAMMAELHEAVTQYQSKQTSEQQLAELAQKTIHLSSYFSELGDVKQKLIPNASVSHISHSLTAMNQGIQDRLAQLNKEAYASPSN